MATEEKKKKGRPRKHPEGAKRVENTSLIVTKRQRERIVMMAQARKETMKETSNNLLKEILEGKHDDLLTPATEKEVASTPITVSRNLAHRVQKYLEGCSENPSEVIRKILEDSAMEIILTTVDGYELDKYLEEGN